jgi:hypothetical protein
LVFPSASSFRKHVSLHFLKLVRMGLAALDPPYGFTQTQQLIGPGGIRGRADFR